MPCDLKSLLAEFDLIQHQIRSYEYALDAMYYDGLTVLPRSGAADNGEASACLAGFKHQIESSQRLAEILDALGEAVVAGPSGDPEGLLDWSRRRQIRLMSRRYQEACALPADLLAEYKRCIAVAFPTWRTAKETNDFALFEPHLQRMFDLLREQASCIDASRHPLDVWLGHWEHGTTMAMCDNFFSQVSSAVAPLVQILASRPQTPRAPFPSMSEEGQLALAWDISEVMGLDPSRLTFGKTIHPYTMGLSRNDVRIAHHFYPDRVLDGVATTMHEGGHALYEQNIDPAYTWTCLRSGVLAGMHECQSRFMENYVGRSRPFMEVLLPLLQKHDPASFATMTPDKLYRAHNQVGLSLIRTAADELTYPLHVLVRYECEKLLLSDKIRACDVPGVWNELMRTHLGVEVTDDAHGCLQDMHWSSDYVAYFPSYALGNAYGAQFLAYMRTDCSASGHDVDACIAAGDLAPITDWLRDRIWRFGKSKDPQEIIADACGEPFDPAYYTRYLVEKFTPLLSCE